MAGEGARLRKENVAVQPLRNEPVFCLVGLTGTHFDTVSTALSEALARMDLLCGIASEAADILFIANLLREYDIVLVDENCQLDCRKIISAGAEQKSHVDSVDHYLLDTSLSRLPGCVQWIADEYAGLERGRPLWGCVLIGGKSSRMGRPKHLLPGADGRSWLERSVEVIQPFVDGLVVSGAGELPESVASLPRLPDIPGIQGPMTGLLAASRWQPRCSWLVAACDMPLLSADGIRWLLEDRCPGIWGRMPKLSGRRMGEPLFAWYDCRGIHQFERLAISGDLRVGQIGEHKKIEVAGVPRELEAVWKNINTPDELKRVIF